MAVVGEVGPVQAVVGEVTLPCAESGTNAMIRLEIQAAGRFVRRVGSACRDPEAFSGTDGRGVTEWDATTIGH